MRMVAHFGFRHARHNDNKRQRRTVTFAIPILAVIAVSCDQPTQRPATEEKVVPATKQKPTEPNWTVVAKKSEMDGLTTISLVARSSDVNSRALIIECMTGKPTVLIDLGDIFTQPELESGHAVRVKFDDDRAERQRWSGSTDNRGLFSRAPGALLRKMLSAHRLLIEYTPFEETTRITSFDLSELNQTITPFRRACGL
jgi:hypothetical protein